MKVTVPKSASFYRCSDKFTFDADVVNNAFAQFAHEDIGKASRYSAGFITDEDTGYLRQIGLRYFFRIRTQEKVISNREITRRLTLRVSEIEQEQNRQVFRSEREQLKDDIISKMMPDRDINDVIVMGWFEPGAKILAVEVGNNKRADELISLIRHALGSLPAHIPAVQSSPSSLLTHWVKTDDDVPAWLQLVNSCSLYDPNDKHKVSHRQPRGTELDTTQLQTYLDVGYVVSSLGVVFAESLECVVGEAFLFRQIKLTTVREERFAKEHEDSEDATAIRCSTWFLFSELLTRMVEHLIKAYGGEILLNTHDEPQKKELNTAHAGT